MNKYFDEIENSQVTVQFKRHHTYGLKYTKLSYKIQVSKY